MKKKYKLMPLEEAKIYFKNSSFIYDVIVLQCETVNYYIMEVKTMSANQIDIVLKELNKSLK
jgi:hypothetical protein